MNAAVCRKADLVPPTPGAFDQSRVARTNIRFVINGITYVDPTPAHLRSMKTGDRVLVRPGVTKPDQLGFTFGDKDIPLPFRRDDPTNAAAAYVDLELALPVHGQQRRHTAAFTDCDELTAMSHNTADYMFDTLAVRALGEAEAATLSLHGGRIWKAVALRAMRVDIPTICACNRWKTAASAEVYARLMPDEHARLIDAASRVKVTKTLTASLRGECTLDVDDIVMKLRDDIERVVKRAGGSAHAPQPAPSPAQTPITHEPVADSDSDDDNNAEQPVRVAGPANALTLVAGSPVAVPFSTRHGQRYFAGTVAKVMPKRARVRFPDVDNTRMVRDVDHCMLYDILNSDG